MVARRERFEKHWVDMSDQGFVLFMMVCFALALLLASGDGGGGRRVRMPI